jgi:uncharacterized membrane protein YbhN (UPF0104 family)
VIASIARSLWFRLGLTLAILAWLATRLDFTEALRAIANVDPLALLVVAMLVALDRVVMIWRWVLLLRATGAPVTTGAAARIFLVSSFVGSFLPAGVGGDAARAWQLSRHTARGHEAIASVAVDRLLGVLAIVALGAAGTFAAAHLLPAEARRPLLAMAAFAAIAAIGLLWVDVLVARLVPARWQSSRPGHRLGAITATMGEYRARPRVLASVLALSFAVQLLRIAQAYGLGIGLGLTVPFRYYLAFMPVGLLMLLLPISVSGFGLPQGVIVWLLRPQGVPDAQSFALSTLIVLSGLAGNLPGAWLYLTRPTAEGSGASDRKLG